MRIEELLLEVVRRGIVGVELPLEGAVGQASVTLQHRDRLVEALVKRHRLPSLSP
jgi:hypothetical protein